MTSDELRVKKFDPSAFILHSSDWLIGLTLFVAALFAYVSVLSPTVLNGDAALYQYIPSVLGVTYPTGSPVYVLLASVWVRLFPVGEIAWRMNLFSAVCAALALSFFYGAARRVLQNRLAAVVSVSLFATLPMFWIWATKARIYTLNVLLFAAVLWLAVLDAPSEAGFLRLIHRHRFKLGALLLGLQVGVHNTTILLIPGVILLFWNSVRIAGQGKPKFNLKWSLKRALWFLVPAALYFYVPLRAEWLIGQYGREVAIAKGLLSDFYQSGLSGWVRYFTAADFTGGVVTNWDKVPGQIFSVYFAKLLHDDFSVWGIGWGLAGAALLMAWPRMRRRAWPFLLLYAAPVPFVLAYGQGQQRAFLLPSDLVFCLFAGILVAWVCRLYTQSKLNRHRRAVNLLLSGAVLGVSLVLPFAHLQHNFKASYVWQNRISADYWDDLLNHPLEDGAGVMATWGDLTTMWYMQHAEGRRPDLMGLYPPTEAVAVNWLARGKPLYIAGPVLDEWEPGVLDRYQVTSWGRLVRLDPLTIDPVTIVPSLTRPIDVNYEDYIGLRGAEFSAQVNPGDSLYVTVWWQALTDLSRKTRYSLRLMQGDTVLASKDDTINSGWFPLDYTPAGNTVIGAYAVDIPLGFPPGTYRLKLAAYDKIRQAWFLPDGSQAVTLGEITVNRVQANTPPGAMRFGGQIALDSYDFGVKRVKQGKGFALSLLWQAIKPPAEDYTLLVEFVDADGLVWRDWRVPVETSGWQASQQVRQQIDVIIPAEFPPGDTSLQIRLNWLTAAGERLPAQRGIFPAGKEIVLPGPRIMAKENRTFEQPSFQTPVEANFEDKAALIGVDLPAAIAAGDGVLPLTLYWQGRGDIREVYSVFVHLVDEQGTIVAQHDGISVLGEDPPTAWAVGEIITDPVKVLLPQSRAPGRYSVVAGMYLPPNGPRLQRLDAGGQAVGDSVLLGTLEVK